MEFSRFWFIQFLSLTGSPGCAWEHLWGEASSLDRRQGSSNSVFLAGDKEQVRTKILHENLTPKKAQS